MAIQFVGANTATRAGNFNSRSNVSLGGLTGGIASEPTQGDLVIAAYAVGSPFNRNLSISDPNGVEYEIFDTEVNASDTFDTNLRITYKYMDNPVDSYVSFSGTGDADDPGSMVMLVFRGVSRPNPNDTIDSLSGFPSVQGAINSVRPGGSIGEVGPWSSGDYLVEIGAGAHNRINAVFTNPHLTSFITVTSSDSSSNITIGAGYKAWPGSNNYSSTQWGFSQSDSSDFSNALGVIWLKAAQGYSFGYII